jgi:hypothetical protein
VRILDRTRVDIQFAVKDVSEFTSKAEGCKKAQSLEGYLKGNLRVVKRQQMPEGVVPWSDTDFAGRKQTRRCTSGGVIVRGERCIKTYSSTQDIIALSSGEADFCGVVKAGSHGLGVVGI